jgi:hypothetical protein
MQPLALLISTLLFCFVYGVAYGAALSHGSGGMKPINARSTVVAVIFAVLLFFLNRPF